MSKVIKGTWTRSLEFGLLGSSMMVLFQHFDTSIGSLVGSFILSGGVGVIINKYHDWDVNRLGRMVLSAHHSISSITWCFRERGSEEIYYNSKSDDIHTKIVTDKTLTS